MNTARSLRSPAAAPPRSRALPSAASPCRRAIPLPSVHPLRVLLALVVLLPLRPAPAAAQTRPFFNDLPDLEVYAAEISDDGVLPGQERPSGLRFTLDGMLEAAPHTRLGLDREVAARLRLGGRLITGLVVSPLVSARADVQLSAPIALGSRDAATELDSMGLVGRHHVWGRVGIGRPAPGDFGADLTVDYRLEHAPDREAFRRAELGPAAYFDQTLDTRVWLRRGLTEELSWAVPLEYRLRRVQYPDAPATLPGFVGHELGSSLGLRPEAPIALDGWLRLVGVSWNRIAFDNGVDCSGAEGFDALSCGAGLPAAAQNGGWDPGSLNQLSLRFGQLDDLVMLAGPDAPVLIHGGMMFGGSWVWDEDDGRNATIFETGLGMRTLVFTEALRFGFGLSFSRLAGFTPAAEHIVAQNRFEHLVEVSSPALGMGFSHRGVFDWIAHPELDPQGLKGLPRPVPSTRLYTEWFTELAESFEVGAYHRADYGPRLDGMALDPWEEGRTWSHELGGFLRIRHGL